MADLGSKYLNDQKDHILVKLKELESRLPDFCRDFLNFYLSVKNAQPRTVLNYARDLDVFFYFLKENNPALSDTKKITSDDMDHLTASDIQEYMVFLENYTKDGQRYQNSGSGKARKLSSLRSLYKYMLNMKMLRNNPTALIPSPKQKKKNIVMMERNEMDEFLENVEDGMTLTETQLKYSDKTKERDIAIVTLLLHTGIRISELVGLDLNDIDFKNHTIRVIRKGGDEDYVYFDEDVEFALKSYMDNERPKNSDLSALFISRKNNRMSVRAVERMVKKYAAVLPNKKITPHKLRSTFATHLYRETGDIYLVKDALHHKNIATTTRYASIGDEKKRTVPELIEEAYRNSSK